MKDLIIIGAGGYGREVLQLALDIQEQRPETDWRVKGFITDIPGDFAEKDTLGYEIIGDITNHVVQANAVYAFAIADIPFKKKVTERFLAQGAEFATLIHPGAIISRTAKIGLGSIIYPRAVVTADANVGKFVRIGGGTTVGHDVVIGDYTVINGICGINGYVNIGQEVFVGSHAVICPHAKVGNSARVGAGSVVLHNVKPGITVFGNPAKKMDF